MWLSGIPSEFNDHVDSPCGQVAIRPAVTRISAHAAFERCRSPMPLG
jgi:hypothetical protein